LLARTIPRSVAELALKNVSRVVVAAVVAYLAAQAMRLPQGFWSVVTAIVVMQGSLGGTLGAGADRIIGTLAGAAFGILGAVLGAALPLPAWIVLALALAPAAFFAAFQPSLRIAPMTAAIVVLVGNGGEVSLRTAFTRTLEILLGTLIGLTTAYLVFPTRAIVMIRLRGSELLEVLGALVEARLTQASSADCDALSGRVRSLLAALEVAAVESARERRMRLSVTSPGSFVVSLRRLRNDVALLGRPVVASEVQPRHADVARAFRAYLQAAAARLRERGPAPQSASLRALLSHLPGGNALALTLGVLADDFETLAAAMKDIESSPG